MRCLHLSTPINVRFSGIYLILKTTCSFDEARLDLLISERSKLACMLTRGANGLLVGLVPKFDPNLSLPNNV